ncbi:unnamed protein product [Lactuca virosa]|uniref:Uncharacterized protein n=1 Tax=Lactuca virosa TaxID=75947 RepID=A0AAU9PH86_9ASTR|nr:unnamed protein product [Lactuca virosa]
MIFVDITLLLGRKKSERILLKTAFSKFTNEESNPLLIDIEDEDNQGNETGKPRIRREGQKKCVEERVNCTPDNSMQRDLKVVVLSSDSKKNMKTKVNVKKFAAGKERVSKSKKKIQKQKGLIQSVDMTEDNEIHRQNELRTKRRFDSCKIKGDEVVVLNSCSGKHKVTVKKLNEDEDSDFEDAKPVLIRKKRMHYTSFKDDDKENVKKLKRQKNKEGNVVKARKMPKVVGNDAEEARRIQVRTSPNVLYSYRMVLNLHHGDIPINRQVIHELLGLPLGNVTIKSMAYREVTDDTITVWKKQFDDEDNIRPRAVQQVIMQTTRADLLFKETKKCMESKKQKRILCWANNLTAVAICRKCSMRFSEDCTRQTSNMFLEC